MLYEREPFDTTEVVGWDTVQAHTPHDGPCYREPLGC